MEPEVIAAITYYMDNGTIGPQLYRQNFYLISENDILEHQQYDYKNSLIFTRTYTLEQNTCQSIMSFIENNDIAGLQDYYSGNAIGGSSKSIQIDFLNPVKKIAWGGAPQDLPASLVELEAMITGIIP